MRNKFKRTLAFIAALALCGSTMLSFPYGTFSVSLPAFAAEGDVEINETNFPDETFRDYVNTSFDTTDDNMLTADEIAAVTSISVNSQSIASLTGIEYFTGLEKLYCTNNQLKYVNLDKNTAWTYLYCSNNSSDIGSVSCTGFTIDGLDTSRVTSVTNGTLTDGVFKPDKGAAAEA